MGIKASQELYIDPIQKYSLMKKITQNKAVLRCPNTGQIVLSFQTTFPSTQQLQKYQIQLRKRNAINHQHYLSPIQHYVITTTNLCSKQYRFIQLFPYENYTLQQEVENRVAQKRSFTWKEVWSILCSCVLAMSHFVRNQIVHYCLNPQDIVLNSEGNIKILAQELSAFVFDYVIKQNLYYSPQMLKALKNSTQITLTSKSGVFTLAITILHLIYLKPFNFLYNLEHQTIDLQNLGKHIQKVADDDIRQILKTMVKAAPYQRITFTQLQEMLYGVLQRKNTQSQQLQRLENSICKVQRQEEILKPLSHQLNTPQPCIKTFQQFQQKTLPSDVEDFPSKLYILASMEHQQTDEKQLNMEVSIAQEEKLLSDVTNVQLAKQLSFKILPHNTSNIHKKAAQISLKTQRKGQQYVTEQYNRGKYQGYKDHGMRHGFGTFYFIEGGKYCGQWSKNKMEGRGALYYCDGNIAYEGEWKKDQFDGYGVLYNQIPKYINDELDWKKLNFANQYWVKYQGNFKEDQKHGEGTLYFTNGQYFKGKFQNDLAEGEGIYKVVGGNLKKGYWKKGIFMDNTKKF